MEDKIGVLLFAVSDLLRSTRGIVLDWFLLPIVIFLLQDTFDVLEYFGCLCVMWKVQGQLKLLNLRFALSTASTASIIKDYQFLWHLWKVDNGYNFFESNQDFFGWSSWTEHVWRTLQALVLLWNIFQN